jgi:NADH-quinone oxidoreductase subunit K
MAITLNHYLTISAILFALGLFGIMTRRNAVVVLMGVEPILNAANINLIAFSRYNGNISGVMFSIFVIILAAAEAAVSLAIVLNIYATFRTVNVDQIDTMRE